MNVTYQNGWAVPAGWKMVPEEPTEEMLAATSWPGCAKTDYRHMLRAAPQPAQAQQPVSGADELLAFTDHAAEPVKVPSDDLAHEIWAAAQTAPGEGIEAAVERVAAILARRVHHDVLPWDSAKHLENADAVGGSTLQAVVSLPWRIDQDNDKGLCVVDARGEIVYVEDWGGIPDEMSSGMREQIIEQARANARFMVAASVANS
jgi:hypothetical protein